MQSLHDNVIRTLINLAVDGSPSERIAALAEARFWIADQRNHGDFVLAPETSHFEQRVEDLVRTIDFMAEDGRSLDAYPVIKRLSYSVRNWQTATPKAA